MVGVVGVTGPGRKYLPEATIGAGAQSPLVVCSPETATTPVLKRRP